MNKEIFIHDFLDFLIARTMYVYLLYYVSILLLVYFTKLVKVYFE